MSLGASSLRGTLTQRTKNLVMPLKRALSVLAISLAACEMGGSATEDAEPVGKTSRAHTVYIHDFAYLPQNLVIAAGDTVVFKNLDMVQHSAVGSDWTTGDLGTDVSARVVLDEPGEHRYHCAPHPAMLGRIEVR